MQTVCGSKQARSLGSKADGNRMETWLTRLRWMRRFSQLKWRPQYGGLGLSRTFFFFRIFFEWMIDRYLFWVFLLFYLVIYLKKNFVNYECCDCIIKFKNNNVLKWSILIILGSEVRKIIDIVYIIDIHLFYL